MDKYKIIIVVLTLLELCLQHSEGIRWLALAQMSSIASTIKNDEICSQIQGLSKRQQKICSRNLPLMSGVQNGALRAIEECQHQFSNRRWNCSTLDTGTIFGNALSKGTREASFVHAISSAGVAYSVTRECSSGQLTQCGCDRSVKGKSPQGFEWAGCSDNIAFGSAFSRTFVDARERTRKKTKKWSRTLMNLHNNAAGRKVVEENLRVQCKCHGVSGSCELRTCWKSLPSFREIGSKLKDKFDGASEVEHKLEGTKSTLVPRRDNYKRHTSTDLVYLVSSPDFCNPDTDTGSLGTSGRLCKKDSEAMDGCDLMCCGRGYKTRERIIVERCHCKFHWCCTVKCKSCERLVQEHICN